MIFAAFLRIRKLIRVLRHQLFSDSDQNPLLVTLAHINSALWPRSSCLQATFGSRLVLPLYNCYAKLLLWCGALMSSKHAQLLYRAIHEKVGIVPWDSHRSMGELWRKGNGFWWGVMNRDSIKMMARGVAIELIWPAKGGRCRRMLCHYEVKCRKALWLQARETLCSNCKRSQSNESRFVLCKKYELLLRSPVAINPKRLRQGSR